MKCAWIENMISIETDGYTRPCCLEASPLAKISNINDGILAAFNHPKLINLRNNLKNGYNETNRDFCYRCEQLENKNQPSLRTVTPELSKNRELKLLQFKMSNKCQLTCAHCGPMHSSSWGKLMNITPHVNNSFKVTDEFLDELKEILPQLEMLKFTGGEPFLDPNHWKILESLQNLDKSHCKLIYITNGLVKPKHHLWDGWGAVNCSVSADGYKDSFEWFRRGANWDELVDSVDTLNKHANVTINFSITPYTIQDYHNAKDFWKFPFYGFTIVKPVHASLFDFPREKLKEIPNYDLIPGYDSTTTSSGDLNSYIQWATNWDEIHKTPDLAKKILWWMK
jgi:organic radical activating enzyme